MTRYSYLCEAGRSIYRNGQPFVFLSRSEEGAYVNPKDADAFARFCAEVPEVLRQLADRADGLDARLLALSGSEGDPIPLGEVKRARDLLDSINASREA